MIERNFEVETVRDNDLLDLWLGRVSVDPKTVAGIFQGFRNRERDDEEKLEEHSVQAQRMANADDAAMKAKDVLANMQRYLDQEHGHDTVRNEFIQELENLLDNVTMEIG